MVGNALLAGVIFILFGVFSFNFFTPSEAETYISLEPRGNAFNTEEAMVVDVLVVSRVPINAIDAEIRFPKDRIEVVGVATSSSIIDLWVKEPTYSNESGLIMLTGGTTLPGGVVGKSLVASITMQPTAAGPITLDISHSLILAHDGAGTDTEEDAIDAAFIVNELQKPDGTRVVRSEFSKEYTVDEKAPPSPDINGDGRYSVGDLSAFLPRLGSAYTEENDFNQDGKVNIKDVSILLSKILSPQ